MARQANWKDLSALETVDKRIAAIRGDLQTIAELEGVADVLVHVDQLNDAVADIAANVEMELHERGARKDR
jgi:hypothetical protein